jgi:hypothetical protein
MSRIRSVPPYFWVGVGVAVEVGGLEEVEAGVEVVELSLLQPLKIRPLIRITARITNKTFFMFGNNPPLIFEIVAVGTLKIFPHRAIIYLLS